MIPPCPRCGKDDFKKTRDLTAHLKRKFKCKPKPVRPKSSELQPLPRPQSPAPVDHTKRKDRRKNKLQVINPTPVLEPESISQTQVPSPTLQDADDESFENVHKPEQHPTQQIEDQRIMDHFSNKSSIDLSNDQNNSINDDASSQTDVSNSSGDSSSSKKLDTKVKVVPPIPQSKSPPYDRTYFCNKTLDQYPALYREFSNENFDYYGITDETSCSLCSLDHNDEESIEGMYKSRSYFITCEQREIETTA
ncbi:hypothetical protein GLOIN_2v1762669 [Rhizophagus irregularis DAOM 181602=DAOM 197198]|nr:hypothetical protein GLOIN_2v1762669 [Rhizophagus irregularis DAOM 181602=DAOM 197198]